MPRTQTRTSAVKNLPVPTRARSTLTE